MKDTINKKQVAARIKKENEIAAQYREEAESYINMAFSTPYSALKDTYLKLSVINMRAHNRHIECAKDLAEIFNQ